jgi:hypothetical protein
VLRVKGIGWLERVIIYISMVAEAVNARKDGS